MRTAMGTGTSIRNSVARMSQWVRARAEPLAICGVRPAESRISPWRAKAKRAITRVLMRYVLIRATKEAHMSDNLESYLSGRWVRGDGVETRLVDPVKGDELATVSAKGVDIAGALEFARKQGQGGLRALGYAA